MRVNEAAKLGGGLLLAALLLAWVLWDVDLHQLGAGLRRVWLPGLLAALTINLAHNLPRAWRWRALLEPVRPRVAFAPLFDAILVGYMVSLMPGRLGELARPLMLSAREPVPLAPCLGSVAVDRLLDGLSVIALFAIGLAATPLAGQAAAYAAAIRGTSLLILAALVAGVVLLVAVSAQHERIRTRLAGRPGLVARLLRLALAVAQGAQALGRPRLALRIVAHSALAWSAVVVATWLGVRACGAEVSLAGICLILPLLVLGIALPTPGMAGGYHYAMKQGLTGLLGVEPAVATLAAILMHLTVVLPFAILGPILLVRAGIPLGELMRSARSARGGVEQSS